MRGLDRPEPNPFMEPATAQMDGIRSTSPGYLTARIQLDTLAVLHIEQTEVFAEWLTHLRDLRAKARILARLDSAHLGNLGDARSVSGGVSEIRVDVGPGYRVYFTRRGQVMIILLCGGDKSSQGRDIERARRMAKQIE